MDKIKSLSTKYDGHNFRSKLEAYWALFFNILHIEYEYEMYGFQLGDVNYLPDFYLPELELFVEVKPKQEKEILNIVPNLNKEPLEYNASKSKSHTELYKIQELGNVSDTRVLLANGFPESRAYLMFDIDKVWKKVTWNKKDNVYLDYFVIDEIPNIRLDDIQSEGLSDIYNKVRYSDFNYRNGNVEIPSELMESDIKVATSKYTYPNKNKVLSTIDNESSMWVYLVKKDYTKAEENIREKLKLETLVFDLKRTYTEFEFIFALKSQLDLCEFLDLPSSTAFNDVIKRISNKPTAIIYRNPDGTYLYHNFLKPYKFVGDIINVICELIDGDLSYREVVRWLADVLGAQIIESQNCVYNLEQLDVFMLKISTESKYSNELLKPYLESSKLILEYLVVNLFYDMFDAGAEPCINASITGIREGIDVTPKLSESHIHRVLNILCLSGIITKLGDDDAPKWLLHKLQDYRVKKGYLYRADIYTLNFIDDLELYKKVEEDSKYIISKKFKPHCISYSYTLGCLGEDYAKRVYIQDSGNIKEDLTELKKIEDMIEKIILKSINNKGYILEYRLISTVSKKLNTTKFKAQMQILTHIGNISERNDLTSYVFTEKYIDKFKPPKKVKTALKFYMRKIDMI